MGIITTLLALLVGFYLGLSQNKTTMMKFWKRHPILKFAFLVTTIPFAFVLLFPFDKYYNDATFKEYIETYKNQFIKTWESWG